MSKPKRSGSKSKSPKREPKREPKKEIKKPKRSGSKDLLKKKIKTKEVKSGDQKIYRSSLNVLMNSNKKSDPASEIVFKEAVTFIYENITDFLVLVRAEGTLEKALIEARTEFNFELGPTHNKLHSHGTIMTTQKRGMIHLNTALVRKFMDGSVGSIFLRVWATKQNTAPENYLRK